MVFSSLMSPGSEPEHKLSEQKPTKQQQNHLILFHPKFFDSFLTQWVVFNSPSLPIQERVLLLSLSSLHSVSLQSLYLLVSLSSQKYFFNSAHHHLHPKKTHQPPGRLPISTSKSEMKICLSISQFKIIDGSLEISEKTS